MLGELGHESLNVRTTSNLLIHPQYSSWESAGFEQANQPTLSDVERRGLLNFCIVGAYERPYAFIHKANY